LLSYNYNFTRHVFLPCFVFTAEQFFFAKDSALKAAQWPRAKKFLSISTHTSVKYGTKQVHSKGKRGNYFPDSDGSSGTSIFLLTILG